ncbi:MAG: ATP-binding protein [Deltaproteobacteria bacterium]|nr:ATP-binding protein [Deltaproteobacteria bacterium]
MATRGEVKEVIDSWKEWLDASLKESLPRDLDVQLPKKAALALIGVRRCGKSYEAVNLIRPHAESTFCMNFEDPFFIQNNKVSIFDELLSVFTEFSQKMPQFLFFDEIHNIEGWERWVRKVVDQKKFQIVLTGSSAKMLSSELATSLTGRSFSQTIWPLSFREYLRFKNLFCRQNDEYLGALRSYLHWGGFPEVAQLSEDTQKIERLRQYLTDILYKDVMKRHEIRSARALEQMTRFYLTNVSCLHSYNSIRKAFGINAETAADYTRFLQEAFLLFEVSRFHPNLKVQSRDPKKIYAVDTGLRNANASSPQEDLGKLAENAVYLHLRRKGCDVSYFKEEGEVDFVVTQFGKPHEALQVSYDDLQEKTTWEREVYSLLECLKALKLPEGILLTLKREESLTIEKKRIRMIPLFQWLLQN